MDTAVEVGGMLSGRLWLAGRDGSSRDSWRLGLVGSSGATLEELVVALGSPRRSWNGWKVFGWEVEGREVLWKGESGQGGEATCALFCGVWWHQANSGPGSVVAPGPWWHQVLGGPRCQLWGSIQGWFGLQVICVHTHISATFFSCLLMKKRK